MTNQLIALLDGREVGTIHYKDSRLSFAYSDTWRNDPNTYPLSLSMPLGSATHGHARIEAFLWGLLAFVYARWDKSRTGQPVDCLYL